MFFKSCCLLLLIFSECLTTRITRLEVPAVVRLGDSTEVVLDCEYGELDASDKAGLTVKWSLNNVLVYQWIESHGLPSANNHFKEHIDLERNVSGTLEQRFRALRIINPVAALSGDYSCQVSTYTFEDIQQKHLQFYDPGQGPTLHYETFPVEGEEGDGSSVKVDCEVAEVYPAPELTITIDGEVVNQTQVSYNATEGRYNASTSAFVSSDALAVGAELRCDLALPATPYNNSDLITYSGSPEAVETESARPAAVGEGSPWAAGGEDTCARAASSLLLLLGVASALHRLALPLATVAPPM